MAAKDTVVRDAIRLTAILNKHLAEENCHHNVMEIAKEALNSEPDLIDAERICKT